MAVNPMGDMWAETDVNECCTPIIEQYFIYLTAIWRVWGECVGFCATFFKLLIKSVIFVPHE